VEFDPFYCDCFSAKALFKHGLLARESQQTRFSGNRHGFLDARLAHAAAMTAQRSAAEPSDSLRELPTLHHILLNDRVATSARSRDVRMMVRFPAVSSALQK